MMTIWKLLVTILIAVTLTACGGGGGGGGSSATVISEDIITWENGIYDEWAFTSTTVSSTDTNCTVDIYSRDIWWEQYINGNATGIKGALIRTETEERNEQCTVPEPDPVVEIGSTSSTATTSSIDYVHEITTTSTTEDRVSTDANGSTVTKTFVIYTDKTTTTATTTIVATTTTITTYSDGSTTTKVDDPVTTFIVASPTVKTATREELINTVVTANVASTSTSDSVSTSTLNGTVTVTTTSTTEDRVSTDANGSTVVKTYTIYTDSITTPNATVTTVTTTRITLWTDDSTTIDVIDTTQSVSPYWDVVSTTTREELTNTVVTANVSSTSTVYLNERTSTSSGELVSELYGTNSDTITVGTDIDGNPIQQAVTLYYYSWHKIVSTTVLKDQYTRTTYTDGSVVDSLVTTDIVTPTTTAKEYLLDPWGGKQTTTQRVPIGETFIGNPVAPDGSSGSSGVYTYAQRDANHNTTNYDATTYYNDTALGTPTVGVNNDPATYETTESENGAVLVTYANHAYSRGWTGKGSTALIMDTGIDQDHPEFTGKVKYLWDAGYATPFEDENGHGSHVAGIVSANKDGIGIHGVAFDTDLAIAKIGEANGISFSGAKQALEWAKQYDDIVVANLSANVNYSSSYKDSMTDQGNGVFTNNHEIYGGTNYYNLEDVSSWKNVLPSELVLVVSAGNTDAGYVQNPATLATAVDANGVLELDGRMLVAGNWNTSTQTIDGAKSGHVCKDYTTQCNDTYKTSDFYLLAPGSNINSVANGGGYTRMSGTSMAAPVVTAGVSIVHQMWPYMKGSDIAQVLLQTADKDLSNYSVNTHGQGLLDLDQATQPIGTLGISTTGRTGDTATISGTISVNGLDSATVSAVSAVDDFDRDFTVDLSSMVKDNVVSMQELRHNPGQSWGVKFANVGTREYNNLTVGTDNNGAYVLGYKHNVNSNLDLGITYTNTNDSPWINISGTWGEVNGSKTIDTSITWNKQELWAQLGLMNTSTDIEQGLVNNVDDVLATYLVGGINKENFTFYAGIKPKVIKGNVNLTIPSFVDDNGDMYYNDENSKINNEVIAFIGTNAVFDFDEEKLDVDVILDEKGNNSIDLEWQVTF